MTDGPTIRNVTDGPTIRNVTDGPTITNVTDGPTIRNVTDGPTIRNETDRPTIFVRAGEGARKEVRLGNRDACASKRINKPRRKLRYAERNIYIFSSFSISKQNMNRVPKILN